MERLLLDESTPEHVRDARPMNLVARAALVNRTHRVVRERAKKLQTRRRQNRSLWIPMSLSAILLIMSATAVWSMLDEYEVAPTGIPDASDQMLVFLLWFLPASAVLLAMIWSRRSQSRAGEELSR